MGFYRQAIIKKEVERFGADEVLKNNPNLRDDDKKYVESLKEDKQNSVNNEQQSEKKAVAVEEEKKKKRPVLNPVGAERTRQRFLKGA